MLSAEERYRVHADAMAERSIDDSRLAREIARKMPGIAQPSRRRAALKHLRVFCETYFPSVFYAPWSEPDLEMLDALDDAMRNGSQAAMAAPRGTGKSTRARVATIFAVLAGLRRFPVLVGVNEDKAREAKEVIYSLLCFDSLRSDFPECCYPIWYVRNAQQARPLFLGNKTGFKNNDRELIFPRIPGSPANGARIACAGILSGNIRGTAAADAEREEIIRPDAVFLDDFQDEESARSPTQCESRLGAITGAIQGMNATGKTLAAVAVITVIERNDAADQLLNRKKFPAWRGLRYRFIEPVPTEAKADDPPQAKVRVEHWHRYMELRADEMLDGGKGVEALAYYEQHRAEMDWGITCRWPHRFEPEKLEISAIQHAVNVIQDRGLAALHAELNNEPLDESNADVKLNAAAIQARLNRLPRNVCPTSATRLTGFVDVHGDVLYWGVMATDDAFRADFISYGTYPEQRRRFFTKDECHNTYTKKHADQPHLAAQLTAALHATWDMMFGATYKREDGLEMTLDRVLTDIKWGEQKQTVVAAMKSSQWCRFLWGSEGEGVTERSRGFETWKLKLGERRGPGWIDSPHHGSRRVRIDTNHWKSQFASMLNVAVGAPGSINLYGSNPDEHRLLAAHWTSEEATRKEEKRAVLIWKSKVPYFDNHWLDCGVNCLVGASMLGAKLVGAKPTTPEASNTAPRNIVPMVAREPLRVEVTESGARKIIPRRISRRRADD